MSEEVKPAAPAAPVVTAPIMSTPAPQAKVELKVKSMSAAAAAVKAAREAAAGAALAKTGASPVHKDGAPGAPTAEVDKAKLAAQAAAENPPKAPEAAPAPTGTTTASPAVSAGSASVAAPTGTPTSTQPSTQPASTGNPVLDRSWENLHKAEMKLLEQRKQMEAEVQRAKAQAAQAGKLAEYEAALKDPQRLIQLAEQTGLTKEQVARAIIAASNPGASGGTQTAPQSQQPSRATASAPASVASAPATDGFQPDTSSPQLTQALERVGQLEQYILNREVDVTLLSPEFEILRGEPDARDRVIRTLNNHFAATGQRLTFAEGAARVQDELVAAVKTRAADPRFAKVLGLNGSSAAPSAPGAAQEKQDVAPGDAEEPTTLTTSLSTSAPMSTYGRVLNEKARQARTMEAIRRARQTNSR